MGCRVVSHFCLNLLRLKNYKYSILSILISIACVVYLILLNYRLAQNYLQVDGKTRALYGIIELSWVVYKVYLIPFLILSAFFWNLAIRKKEARSFYVAAILVSVIAIALIFVRIWVWMV